MTNKISYTVYKISHMLNQIRYIIFDILFRIKISHIGYKISYILIQISNIIYDI